MLICRRTLVLNLSFFLRSARDMRRKQLAAIGHGRNQRRQLHRRHFEIVSVRRHMVDSIAGLQQRQATGKLALR